MIRFLLPFFLLLTLIGCGSKATPNKAPTAKPTANHTTVSFAQTVTLNARSSSDSDGKIVKYSWTDQAGFFGTGIAIKWQAPKKPGYYILHLTVTDDDGATDTESIMIVVENQAPVAKITIDKNRPVLVLVNETFTLDANTSSDSDGNITHYQWLENATPIPNTDNMPQVSLSVPEAATYTIELIVTDNLGKKGKTNIKVTATKPAGPFGSIKSVISAGNATYICVGDSTRAIGEPYYGGALFKELNTSLSSSRHNVHAILSAKAGREAKQFNEANDSLLPNWIDVASKIPSDGDSTIVDISLGINDLFSQANNFSGTAEDIKKDLKEAINKIKAKKPKTHFILTMPTPKDPATLDYDGTYDRTLENAYKSLSVEMNIPLISTRNTGIVFNYIDDEIHFHMQESTQKELANFILEKILPY